MLKFVDYKGRTLNLTISQNGEDLTKEVFDDNINTLQYLEATHIDGETVHILHSVLDTRDDVDTFCKENGYTMEAKFGSVDLESDIHFCMEDGAIIAHGDPVTVRKAIDKVFEDGVADPSYYYLENLAHDRIGTFTGFGGIVSVSVSVNTLLSSTEYDKDGLAEVYQGRWDTKKVNLILDKKPRPNEVNNACESAIDAVRFILINEVNKEITNWALNNGFTSIGKDKFTKDGKTAEITFSLDEEGDWAEYSII